MVEPEGSGITLKPRIEVMFSEKVDIDTLIFQFEGVGGYSLENGLFTFETTMSLKPGKRYEVFISCSDLVGNLPVSRTWTFTTTDEGTVQGRIVDEQGDPITGARITGHGGSVLFTDPSGYFFLKAQMGEMDLVIEADGMKTLKRTVEVRPDEEVDIGTLLLEEEQDPRDRPIEIFAIIIFAFLMLLIIIGGVVIVRNRKKDDFEFFIDGDTPRRKKNTGKINGDDFEDFWIDMGDEILHDHYQVLGITRSSSPVEIKKAYRIKAAKYHPDRAHPLDDLQREEMADMMAQVNEAKEVLLNPVRRMMYDAWLHDREM
jgi:hypothetical protein